MCSQDLAHKFFYNPDERGEYARVNTHFRKSWNSEIYYYYSYSTVIAILCNDKNGRRVCLVTNEKYSVTTAKHVREILSACPFDVLFVPVANNYDQMYNFAGEFGSISKLDPAQLQRKENRESVLHAVRMFDEYAARFDVDKNLIKVRKSRAVLDVLECVEFINAKREKRQTSARSIDEIMKARKRRAAESLRKVKQFAKNDVLLALQLAFGRNTRPELSDALKIYRESLRNDVSSNGRRFSYVWIDGEKCKTSQGVTVAAQDVAKMLRIWAAGRDILGAKIDYYTITAKTPEFVQIGCHCIPVWNLNALNKKLNGAK